MNGTLLGDRFVLEREVGSGGMARVFLGKDIVLERPVAVKVLNPGHDETDIGSRFRREGRTAARLSHPNIVQVFDAGETELNGKNVSYIVMEYVPGGDLKGLIDKQGTLSEGDLARLGAGAAAGLAHAHERGVIHRDVKPHNVLIDSYGEPKLTDFGIARALDATTSHATRTGAYLGTALYSAPEQLRGQGVTPKSDVYSLGVTLYQAAVGEAPFVGTPIEVAGQHIHQLPVPPGEKGVGVGGMVEGLILACLSKDPDLRPTAEEVHEKLRQESSRLRELAMAPPPPEPAPVRQVPRSAPTTSPAPQRSQRHRRGPLLLLGAASLLLVLLGIAAFEATRGGDDPVTASNHARDDGQAEPAAENERQEPAATAENSEPAEESEPAQGEQQEPPQEDAAQDQQQAQQPEAPPAAGDQAGTGNVAVQATQESSPAEDAERAVEQFYASAADGEYETSSALLAEDWRQSKFPDLGVFEGTFATLQDIEFVEGPTAQVSGDTATVTGVTIATHDDRTERNQGTWTLVNDGGEWFISGWTLSNIETVYV